MQICDNCHQQVETLEKLAFKFGAMECCRTCRKSLEDAIDAGMKPIKAAEEQMELEVFERWKQNPTRSVKAKRGIATLWNIFAAVDESRKSCDR